MSRTVAITGVTGFIGRHVASNMQRAGWTVTGIVRPGSPREPPDGIRCMRARLIDADLLGPFDGAEVVIHLAGVVRAGTPQAYAAVNVEGTRHVAQAAARTGARFIHVSSQAAAGGGLPSAPRTEDDPPRPITPYGHSKLAGERCVQDVDNLQWTILRSVAVYGPGDKGFLPLFRLARRGWFPVVGHLDTAYTLIHVDDLSRAIEAAAATAKGAGHALFIGGESPVTTERFLQTLATSVKRAYRPHRIPGWLLRVAAEAGQVAARLGYALPLDRSRLAELRAGGFVCSVTKAHDLLGFSSEIALADGLARTAEWYLRKGWL